MKDEGSIRFTDEAIIHELPECNFNSGLKTKKPDYKIETMNMNSLELVLKKDRHRMVV